MPYTGSLAHDAPHEDIPGIMYLTYFDDTGGTGQNYLDSEQPVQGLCSVSIDEDKWRAVEQSCRLTVAKFFPREEARYLIWGKFELHASAIYQASGAFKALPFQTRLDLLYSIVDIIVSHRLPILGAFIEKKNADSCLAFFQSQSLDDVLFARLYADLNSYLSRNNESKHAMIIGDHDSMRPQNATRWNQRLNSHVRVPRIDPYSGRPYTHILGSLQFLDSSRSFGIQLADTAAYLIRRRLTHPQQTIPATEYLLNAFDMRFEQMKMGIWHISGGW